MGWDGMKKGMSESGGPEVFQLVVAPFYCHHLLDCQTGNLTDVGCVATHHLRVGSQEGCETHFARQEPTGVDSAATLAPAEWFFQARRAGRQ
jgi:hypothetical protein